VEPGFRQPRAGTLVSPRHVVFAQHASTAAGATTRVRDAAERHSASRRERHLSTDIGVSSTPMCRLIEFYRVLPRNWSDFPPQTNNLPMLHLDQEKALTTWTSWSAHRPTAQDSGGP
jgi:hypothetical protein